MACAVVLLVWGSVVGGVSASPAATAPAAKSASAPAAKPGAAAASAAAPASDAQFFGELGYKDYASAADTARALTILLSEGKENQADFQACKAYLHGKSLTDSWLDKAQADDAVEKSQLAVLVCRALGIKGGLWMQLFGCQPRLALRECAYLELMESGAEYCRVTGGELVGVIDRCDRFRTEGAGGVRRGIEATPASGKPKAEAPPAEKPKSKAGPSEAKSGDAKGTSPAAEGKK
jgi:hypothetical protein